MSNKNKCSSASSCGRESCEGCPSASDAQQKADFSAKLNAGSSVKKVIAVVSGKGGVGKSLLTGLLASSMQRRGRQCAVLDADITGPSMCKNLGVSGKAQASDAGILPKEASGGVKVVSANMFLPNETDPVVWRGPIISGMVKQFWSDVLWGDVDYMFVDMPPGTGDVPLTVFQSLPVDGIIIVTSPQELVSMIVAKAVKMAKMMNIPIIGLVENYAYFHCPDNDKDYEIFGPSHINETAMEYGLQVLARLPINPELAKACDAGRLAECEVAGVEACIDYIEKNV